MPGKVADCTVWTIVLLCLKPQSNQVEGGSIAYTEIAALEDLRKGMSFVGSMEFCSVRI